MKRESLYAATVFSLMREYLTYEVCRYAAELIVDHLKLLNYILIYMNIQVSEIQTLHFLANAIALLSLNLNHIVS